MEVTTAAIIQKGDFYLIAKRLPGGSMSERWEFPGGKAETGESPENALKRELFEEFAVQTRIGLPVANVEFCNKDRVYALTAFEVVLEEEIVHLNEHEEIRWLPLSKIAGLDLADSDRRILDLLIKLRSQA